MATPLRHLLRQRRAAPAAAAPLCGTWSLLGSAAAAQTLAGQGFDFVVVDREHSDLSTCAASAIVAALVARGVAPAVRVPRLDPDGKSVMRALDCGCTTVVVPNVRTADEVSLAVRASLFPPSGFRGCNPFVPAASLAAHFGCEEMVTEQNDAVMVVPMVENAEAVGNIQGIVAVEGLKALLFGPFDLSVSLGDEGVRTPRVDEMIRRSVDAALEAGVEPIMPVFGASVDAAAEAVGAWSARGVQCFTVGIDSAFLAQRAGAFLGAVKGSST
jgi:2-keto-3-deoxy-L-rhamnonate aldolase RhmA